MEGKKNLSIIGEIDAVIGRLIDLKERAKRSPVSTENEVFARSVENIYSLVADIEKCLNEEMSSSLDDLDPASDGKVFELCTFIF